MAVVINDFEIVEPAASEPASTETNVAPASSQAYAPTALEMEQLIRHQEERAARLRAH
jgi:hypothetical protein